MVELKLQLGYSPRRLEDFQSALLKQPEVQNCLRLEPQVRENTFFVNIEGRIDSRGHILETRVPDGSQSLSKCLETAAQTVKLGRGKTGPFKLKLIRTGTSVPNFAQQPGILLDLRPPKKWE